MLGFALYPNCGHKQQSQFTEYAYAPARRSKRSHHHGMKQQHYVCTLYLRSGQRV